MSQNCDVTKVCDILSWVLDGSTLHYYAAWEALNELESSWVAVERDHGKLPYAIVVADVKEVIEILEQFLKEVKPEEVACTQ